MNNLRVLALVHCLNLSFISALNPNRNASNMVVCPKLEELALCFGELLEEPFIDDLLEMAKERASRGARLATIAIICPQEFIPSEKVFSLRRYVSQVEYTLDVGLFGQDTFPSSEVDGADETDDESD